VSLSDHCPRRTFNESEQRALIEGLIREHLRAAEQYNQAINQILPAEAYGEYVQHPGNDNTLIHYLQGPRRPLETVD
jgi:hypothetical protein